MASRPPGRIMAHASFPEVHRIVADADLDGLCAAAILQRALPGTDVVFAHPALVRSGHLDELIDRRTQSGLANSTADISAIQRELQKCRRNVRLADKQVRLDGADRAAFGRAPSAACHFKMTLLLPRPHS